MNLRVRRFSDALMCRLRRRRKTRPAHGSSDIEVSQHTTRAPYHKSKWTLAVLALLFAIGMLCLFRAGALKYEKPGIVLPTGHFAESFYEHLGVALIISSVAGFGYEWLAHHRHLEEQVNILIAINDAIASRQFTQTLTRLVRDKEGDGHVHRQLRKHLNSIVDSIAKMDDTPAGADIVSLRFVTTLLRYADHASDTLSGGDGQNVLLLPRSSALLADEILAEHVRAFSFGDTYDVISDFSTWSWGLEKFRRELDLKVRSRRCHVRRIFCVFPPDSQLDPKRAEAILRLHWDWAVRVYCETKESHYNVGVSLLKPVEHVGIFRQSGGVVCFKPQGEGDLETLLIRRSADREQMEVERHWSTAVKTIDPRLSPRTVLSFATLKARLASVAECEDFFQSNFRGSVQRDDDELAARVANCHSIIEST